MLQVKPRQRAVFIGRALGTVLHREASSARGGLECADYVRAALASSAEPRRPPTPLARERVRDLARHDPVRLLGRVQLVVPARARAHG